MAFSCRVPRKSNSPHFSYLLFELCELEPLGDQCPPSSLKPQFTVDCVPWQAAWEHTAWLPEGCLPKGQPSEEGAESALARGNFIFTLQELEGLPLSFKVLSQRCLWGSRPLKEPEPLIYFVGWSLKPSIGGKRWRCADREGR